jgi:hypothetical protein
MPKRPSSDNRMKITEYKTVKTTANEKDLDDKVNFLIKEGFQPYGNPYILSRTPSMVQVCQAMIKYED